MSVLKNISLLFLLVVSFVSGSISNIASAADHAQKESKGSDHPGKNGGTGM